MRNIVIVPAREKSKEVRYKNLKTLDDKKTLLEIAFENASKISKDIWLSSESSLLIEYAKVIGFDIKERPKKLSTDMATLDEVIDYHIQQDYLNEEDILWVLQPTCPFLKIQTIIDIKKILENDSIQSVFTAKKVKGFYWQEKKDGSFTRFYSNRENRQTMKNNIISETGLLTATRVSYLRTKQSTRFDEGVSLPVLINDLEAIDIDTHLDLMIANSKYKFNDKKALIVTRANSEIGSGHLYRALSICDNSQNIKCYLACYVDEIAENILKTNERAFFPLNSDNDLFTYLRKNNFSVVILDMLKFDYSFLMEIKKIVSKVVIFENSDQDCFNKSDLVFNALYESTLGIKNVFNGYKYEIIRSDIKAYSGLADKNKDLNKKSFKIVVCFGGTDHNHFTRGMLQVYEILENIFKPSQKVEITEILNLSGNNSSNWIPSKSNFSINFIKHSSRVAKEMAQCNLLICGNGRMVYEAASLEKQVLVIPQNSRECSHIFPKALPISIMMDHWTEVDYKDIANNVLKIYNSKISFEQKVIIKKIAKEINDGSSLVWSLIEDIL